MDWEKLARQLQDILEAQRGYIEYLQKTLDTNKTQYIYKSPYLKEFKHEDMSHQCS